MEFMKVAIQEGIEGVKEGHGPFGAVIVKDGKIVTIGHNKIFKDKDPTAHAETDAIRNACKILDTYDLSGCVMYTSCYPCSMCLGAILWAKIDATYYAASREEASAYGFDATFIDNVTRNPNDGLYKFERLETEERLGPFKEWEEKIDKPCPSTYLRSFSK